MNRLFPLLLLALITPVSTFAQGNQPPKAVASAGVDPATGQVVSSVTLYIGPSDATATHTVSGAGSSDPDGDPLSYQWQCADDQGNKCGQLNVVNVTDGRGTFIPGTYHLTLTVKDPSGASSSDSARVKVLVDLNPPTVTPPDDESVSATEAGGARGADSSKLHDFLRGATATRQFDRRLSPICRRRSMAWTSTTARSCRTARRR